MKYKNYYEILNVNRKSSKQDIKLSYRSLAKKYHPDANKTKEAELKFKDINEAYSTLINEEKKKRYDKQVARYGYGMVEDDVSLSQVHYELKSGVTVINDLLTTILGFKKEEGQNFGDINNGPKDANKKPKQKSEKGTDIVTNLEVSLEEGFYGAEKKIAIKAHKTGLRTFAVNVPIGIKNGDKIRLAALGNPGKNGGKNGDLIINVKLVENDEYKLNGIDLLKDIYVSPAFAVIGGKQKLDIFGEEVYVSLPKKLQNGEVVRVEEKGYISEEGKRGDLLLTINIQMPTNITEREEKLYEQILKIEKKKK